MGEFFFVVGFTLCIVWMHDGASAMVSIRANNLVICLNYRLVITHL